MKIKIRRAIKTDYQNIKKLIHSFPKQLSVEIPAVSKFYVATCEKKIIGCCALDIYSKRIAEIRSLAVAKNCHGKGVGTKLVQKCLDLSNKKSVCGVFAITEKIDFFAKFGLFSFQNKKMIIFRRP